MKRNDTSKKSKALRLAFAVIGVAVIAGVFLLANLFNSSDGSGNDTSNKAAQPANRIEAGGAKHLSSNPLAGKKFYVDQQRQAVALAKQYRSEGKPDEAALIERIASQPGTVWLFGPTPGDPTAARDSAEVARTSQEAAKQGTVPVYQLYAMPNRDACAGYSKGGFSNNQDYLAWIDRISGALQTDAVFSVEADAIAQTIMSSCLSPAQADERYRLLSTAIDKLNANRHVLAVYLDAGHSEWFTDPAPLVGPLRKAGVDKVRGVAVNVSNFVATPQITAWSQRLVSLLGGDKGVIIDTSRNGRGSMPADVTGDARWCNPPGRGIGLAPSGDVGAASIDAHLWIKIIGQSDGDCFGNPPAGTFTARAALELARNGQ